MIGLGGGNSLGLISDASPTVKPIELTSNPEKVTGGGQGLALEQEVIGVCAPGAAPNASSSAGSRFPFKAFDWG